MKKRNEKGGKMDYDFDNDSLLIFHKSRRPEDYHISESIDENFILDFNKKGKILGLEILSISKRFGLPKSYFRSITGLDVKIDINEKIIKIDLKICFDLRNKFNEKQFSIEKINQDMLSPGVTNLAIA